MPGGPAGVRVLYVDGAADAHTVATRLERAAAEIAVTTVGGVDAALEILEAERVDGVVSAHQLRDGTSRELLSALEDRPRTPPVVLYPADGGEKLAARAVAAGVDGYRPREPVAESAERVAADLLRAVREQPGGAEKLDRMTDAFFAVDTDWRFTYLNDQGREIVAEATERDVGGALRDRRLWEAVPEIRGTAFEEQYRRAMETQETVSFEEFYGPLDTWFEVRAYPSPGGLSVYFRDVADRKRYEQQLEHRESVLTTMYRIVSEKDSSYEEKIDRLFTIGREEFGTEYATLSRIDGEEYVFEHVQTPPGDDTVESGDVVPLSWTSCERIVTTEERLAIGDMSTGPAEVAERTGNREMAIECYLGSPVAVDGSTYGTVCFYGTEPRSEPFSQWEVALVDLMGNWVSYECERRLREAELTRERNRLDEFASVVSHDLRNPLNVALSHLELARDDGPGQADHLAEIADALDRMGTLIEDVLALARLGGQVVDEEPVRLPRLVRRTWSSVGDTSSRLVVGDVDTVVGDERRLERLFENLFRNAVEHGSTSPDSQARQDAVEHGSTSPGSQAHQDAVEHGDPGVTVRVGPTEEGFFVADDGPGIPEDEREDVFDSGYTTADDGTGFGLAIVAEIVDAHDGEITVTESTEGGACFEITGIEVR